MSKKALKIRYRKVLKAIVSQKRVGILDLGCGQGEFLKFLVEQRGTRNINYFGIDIKKVNNPFPGNTKIKFHQRNLEKDFKFLRGKKFDYILCLEILEHLNKPFCFLKRIKTLLKKNGLIILSTPNPYYWAEISALLSGRVLNEEHLHLFSTMKLKKMCRRLDMKIKKIEATYIKIPLIKQYLNSNPIFSRSNIYYIQLTDRRN